MLADVSPNVAPTGNWTFWLPKAAGVGGSCDANGAPDAAAAEALDAVPDCVWAGMKG